MYEGRIFGRGSAVSRRDAASGVEYLRKLNWAELAVRLAAARDFRRIMARRYRTGQASFDRSSARHLAALGDGEQAVNPFVLGNGKAGQGRNSGVPTNAAIGGRG